jgi:hypothetical protein
VAHPPLVIVRHLCHARDPVFDEMRLIARFVRSPQAEARCPAPGRGVGRWVLALRVARPRAARHCIRHSAHGTRSPADKVVPARAVASRQDGAPPVLPDTMVCWRAVAWPWRCAGVRSEVDRKIFGNARDARRRRRRKSGVFGCVWAAGIGIYGWSDDIFPSSTSLIKD